MTEDWDFYFTLFDNRPATVFVDLALEGAAPDQSRAWLLRVAVALKVPREDGLSDESETELLYAIEDALFARLAGRHQARYAGRITGDGRREHFYYIPQRDSLEQAVAEAMSPFPEYDFGTRIEHDPQWRIFQETLVPDALETQTIHNRRLVEELESAGDDLSQPRDIDHWFYFSSPQARDAFAAQIEPEGFRPEAFLAEEPDAELRHGLKLTRQGSPELDVIDPLAIDLFLRAEQAGGEYDGWGCPVVKVNQ
jgi:regulator of RNase E activity RraB